MNKSILFLISLMAISCTVDNAEICRFKDGLAEHYTLVLPQLERHGLSEEEIRRSALTCS